ncbi:LacI family DNA-binding transcriptional regulator [Phycicoccus endophyticus]|uniref:LacI family DNA-binding transcriptional regulator n=1 Tax=Phycicoccus endophyticus TaxID=1690220 RepID=UPI001992DEDC|nr:LacI family DNA-binding transcriptional regulator [Phycicoccus endophyticus]GGL22763.1 LacI family transcriptional regulator [Phycicoccus endophyticus]
MARAAGVSVATVSRALRGLDRVSPETRRRVLAVAEQLHYVASPTATSLASGRTRVVAVVAPFLTRWFFATLLSAIEKELRAHSHHAILFDLEDDTYDRRLPLTQNMLWKRVDGVITLNVPMDPEEVAVVERLEVPLVSVGSPVPGRPCVRIDDRAAMRTAVEHVLGLGHERVGYVGVVPDTAAHVQTPRDRLAAFRETMTGAGLPVPAEWVLGSDWTAWSAAHDARALLTAGRRPTAVVAASDEMAIGVRECALRLGLRVPEDLSVVGIDDHVLSSVLGLTTVRQDVTAQGRLAARLLLQVLAGEEVPAQDVVLPTELVVRTSTGPAPCSAPRVS